MSQPFAKLKDGLLSATIWQNQSEDGKVRYSVNLSRSFKPEGGEWQETSSFSPTELLKISRLADQAYDRIADFKSSSSQDTA